MIVTVRSVVEYECDIREQDEEKIASYMREHACSAETAIDHLQSTRQIDIWFDCSETDYYSGYDIEDVDFEDSCSDYPDCCDCCEETDCVHWVEPKK